MSEETIMDQIETAIKKGERARILWEMLMEVIEAEYSGGIKELMVKFKQNQEEYYDAIGKVQEMAKVHINSKKLTESEECVS